MDFYYFKFLILFLHNKYLFIFDAQIPTFGIFVVKGFIWKDRYLRFPNKFNMKWHRAIRWNVCVSQKWGNQLMLIITVNIKKKMWKLVDVQIYLNPRNKFEDIICKLQPHLENNIILKEEVGFFEMNFPE